MAVMTLIPAAVIGMCITYFLKRGYQEHLHNLVSAIVFACLLSVLAIRIVPYNLGFDVGLIGAVAGAFLGSFLADKGMQFVRDNV